MKKNKSILEIVDVTKKFKGITALGNARFDLREGEIHTLLGENGAGKSTILNIMSGSLEKDSGKIIYKGTEVEITSPLVAKKMGIIKVHQELQVIPEMTAYENVFLGNELRHPVTKVLDFAKMRDKTNQLLRELEADFDSNTKIKKLSIAQKQMVEIAKALLNNFSVLILDEPTSSLTNREIDKLFDIMRNLKKQGKAIIFVSHRLDEVFAISDRITVFRDGTYVDTLSEEAATRENLIRLMTGRDLNQGTKNISETINEEVVLAVKDLSSIDNRFHHINFELHKGEILGFAGLVGAGRSETMRAIFGADKVKTGQIYINGKKARIRSPKDAIQYGIAFIPEDRKGQGMIGMLPNFSNICMSSLQKVAAKGMLTDAALIRHAEKFMQLINVKPKNPKLKTENLSGGNQQKVVIAKWLSVKAKILIMDEPTRGIDVGAKEEIHNLMLKLTGEGVSIIMISSELPEIIHMSNRIVVMHEGRITGEVLKGEVTENQILHYAMGGQ